MLLKRIMKNYPLKYWDEQPIDVGYFVTFDSESEKVRIARQSDDYILGITSANPVVLGDSAELRWDKKYMTDEWGRVLYKDVEVPALRDEEGNIEVQKRIESKPVINPEWDPEKEYIPRLKRPEWVAVGLLGKIRVRDDGTCQPGGYCIPNDEGIATVSDKGYRVLKRTSKNQILVAIIPDCSKNTISNVEQLEKLARLREQGFLTEEEFDLQKQNILEA